MNHIPFAQHVHSLSKDAEVAKLVDRRHQQATEQSEELLSRKPYSTLIEVGVDEHCIMATQLYCSLS